MLLVNLHSIICNVLQSFFWRSSNLVESVTGLVLYQTLMTHSHDTTSPQQ